MDQNDCQCAACAGPTGLESGDLILIRVALEAWRDKQAEAAVSLSRDPADAARFAGAISNMEYTVTWANAVVRKLRGIERARFSGVLGVSESELRVLDGNR